MHILYQKHSLRLFVEPESVSQWTPCKFNTTSWKKNWWYPCIQFFAKMKNWVPFRGLRTRDSEIWEPSNVYAWQSKILCTEIAPPPPGYGARAKMEAKLVSNFMEKVGVFHLRTCRVHDFQKKGVFLGDMFSPSEKRGFHFYTRVPYPGPPSKSVHWNFAPPPFPCTQFFAPPSLSHPSPGKFTPTCSLPSLSLSSL